MCLSCICLLAMHTLICVTFSLPPGVGGCLRPLLVALSGLFCLPFSSYRVYTSQLIRFNRVASRVADFNTRNNILTWTFLKQGYRYHKLCNAFSIFYRRQYDMVSKFNVGLKSLLKEGLSEPEFYGAYNRLKCINFEKKMLT